ncbi:MAG: DUF5667 domain-containing protein [Anaerolineales bacterium]
MNNIFDALEICLQEIENGADVETVLARFPNLAAELRPILETSVKASNMSVAEPSQEAIRRGRARVMQRAAEMRESKVAPRKRVIPTVQRLALSFSLAAVLLLSGTGLLNASASALPGENLYPVKRTWEGVRLFLIFDRQARTLLEDQFEYERLHEVNELLVEGRHETIQFAGVYMDVNGLPYVSGVPVILAPNVQVPSNGAAVIITGQTNSQGVVQIFSLDLLPEGSVVPVGNPVQVELESEANSNTNASDNANQSPVATPQYYSMEGTLQSVSSTALVINDLTVYPDNAHIKGELCIGTRVEVKGYFDSNGRLIVSEVEAKGSCSSGNENGNSNSGTNTNSQSGNDSSSNNNSGNNDNGDDHGGNSGSDGGGDDHGGGDNSGGGGGD